MWIHESEEWLGSTQYLGGGGKTVRMSQSLCSMVWILRLILIQKFP